jgi:hypothetical protein
MSAEDMAMWRRKEPSSLRARLLFNFISSWPCVCGALAAGFDDRPVEARPGGRGWPGLGAPPRWVWWGITFWSPSPPHPAYINFLLIGASRRFQVVGGGLDHLPLPLPLGGGVPPPPPPSRSSKPAWRVRLQRDVHVYFARVNARHRLVNA